MKKIYVILVMLFMGFTTQAQNVDSPWWVDIELVNNKFDYRYFEGVFDFGNLDNAGVRVGVERYLSKSWDAEFGVSYGKLKYENIFSSNLFDMDLRLTYKLANDFFINETSKIAPFLSAGISMNTFGNVEPFFTEFEDGSYFTIPLTAGVEFKVTDNSSIVASATYKKSIEQAPNYMQYALGVSFALSGKKDSDEDGIYDRDDMCPLEAGPIENNGCPWPDTDGDGVLDKDDACPAVPGTINGCPDQDGDGIIDSEDSCPDVAGIEAFNGCPDSDGDGVQDSEDECPNVAGTLNGCPDSDGDGVKDSEDACPNEAGTLNGCPDTDGDGIRDSDDACPETAGLASNDGCPEVTEEVQEVLDVAVRDIQFNSGSEVLKASAYPALDKVLELMQQNNFDLKLSGYTDSTGNPENNLALSKRRANAVKQYLVDKGIAFNRITADGYGIANPIADNGTAAGRAKNRRVELEIIFR